MRFAKSVALFAVLVAWIAGSAVLDSSGPAPEPRMENLLQQALDAEFTPGREIVVSFVEIPPHTTLERHWHPGEEFHYYLEGRVEIRIDGHPSIQGEPGTVGHVPYKQMHTAITGEEGAKAVVFRVHRQGEPARVLEGGGTSEE